MIVESFLFYFIFYTVNFLTIEVDATGKGTIDVYAINHQYAAVTDSNFDSIFVLDILRGGVVGKLILHRNETKPGDWTNPTGLTSCDDCSFIILTSTHDAHMYRIELPYGKSLLSMAEYHDFSALTWAEIIPYWPWSEFEPNGKIRMVTMRRDGSIGYAAHYDYGLFQFDALYDRHHKNLLLQPAHNIPGKHVSGLNLSNDGRRLVATTPEIVVIYEADERINELREIVNVNLSKLCSNGKYSMHFRDAVLIDDELVAVGHKGGNEDNRGMALYNISSSPGWDLCHTLAGDDLTRPGWIDGFGKNVRFSRPHAMTFIPKHNYLLITDIDNRALRKANLDKGDVNFGQISTISYDEDLWRIMYDVKSKYQQLPTKVLVPKEKTSVHNMTYFEAKNYCLKQHQGRLCSLPEIRSEENIISNIETWTSQPCHSCWLRTPGHCNPPSVIESSAQRDKSAWGAQVFMVAQIQQGDVETKCLHENSTYVVGLPICCSDLSGFN